MKNLIIIFLCFVIMVLLFLSTSGHFCYCQPVRCPVQQKEIRFILA